MNKCIFRVTAWLLLAGLGFAATPAVITSASGPVGIAATTSELLFTQPYCSTAGVTRGVYAVDTVTSTPALIATVPDGPTACTENYLAISLGTGGFAQGDVFVTSGDNI